MVIGGGTGLSTLLRGLKEHTNNLTAIVTVADDGGSSGELRRSLGMLPPGDIRNCLTALSDDETLMGQLFQYRFASGNGLSGHPLGNLFITALAEITGSFEEAVAESGRVLAVHGQVLPATLHDVRLVADVQLPDNGKEVRVQGESQIPRTTGHIRRVWLEPAHLRAYPPTVQAILRADLILVGPGSLYTSMLPNLLVPDLGEALRVSRALKFYVCNVATQPGETDGFTATTTCGPSRSTWAVECSTWCYATTAWMGSCPRAWNGCLPPSNCRMSSRPTWAISWTRPSRSATTRTSWPRRSWTCFTNAPGPARAGRIWCVRGY